MRRFRTSSTTKDLDPIDSDYVIVNAPRIGDDDGSRQAYSNVRDSLELYQPYVETPSITQPGKAFQKLRIRSPISKSPPHTRISPFIIPNTEALISWKSPEDQVSMALRIGNTAPLSPYRSTAPHNINTRLQFREAPTLRRPMPEVGAGHPRADVASVCTKLVGTFQDLNSYKKLLSIRGEAAQSLLDFIQILLDGPYIEERHRPTFVLALLRLSRKSGLIPDRLSLTDVIKDDECYDSGCFGEIYKGYFRGKRICVKVVKLFETSDKTSRTKAFSREAVIWGQLSHPNVLPFYGVYSLKDRWNRLSLVSPWIENGNIKQYLQQNPTANRQFLVSDVAAGILYLHDNNIIHGNLKGSNILVSQSGRACLGDFGLSSVVASQGLSTPSISSNSPTGGTARFQAPELIDPEITLSANRASDIYAFSMVCYEIYSGHCPFPEFPNDVTVMIKVIQGHRPTHPSVLDPSYQNIGLTDTIWHLMEDCWKQTPSKRPTASEITTRLRYTLDMDWRPSGEWGGLNRSSVHNKTIYLNNKSPDSLVPGVLRTLEMGGVFPPAYRYETTPVIPRAAHLALRPRSAPRRPSDTAGAADLSQANSPPVIQQPAQIFPTPLDIGGTSLPVDISSPSESPNKSVVGNSTKLLIDLLQSLLDRPRLPERLRPTFIYTLLHISSGSALIPECLSLSGVSLDEVPQVDGHFGTIHKGQYRGKPVCVKVVKLYHESDDAVLMRDFSREAVLWGQLSHINVLPFYGMHSLGDKRKRVSLVSPWMEQGNINQYLQQNPAENRQLLVSDVAAGIVYLHKMGVVHGDLKGRHILVSRLGRACLTGFDLSFMVVPQGSDTSSIPPVNPEGGTLRYHAPELIELHPDGSKSRASDIYAFAMTCYEIYTGYHPFPEIPDSCTVMDRVMHGDRPRRPLGYRYSSIGLTDTMWKLMEECWDHIPDSRPTAAQILKQLPLSADERPSELWSNLVPSPFRTFEEVGRPDSEYDLGPAVAEALRLLSTIAGMN